MLYDIIDVFFELILFFWGEIKRFGQFFGFFQGNLRPWEWFSTAIAVCWAIGLGSYNAWTSKTTSDFVLTRWAGCYCSSTTFGAEWHVVLRAGNYHVIDIVTV